jgi:pimeloyl-[acyl-carrier protein] methyl ester esterase
MNRAADATLHVESVGAGPPLVLLHGWGMHSGLWGPLLPWLAARLRVHAVDLPGHGHSANVEAPTLDAMTDAIAARFADESAPLTVAGWSLGGLVALHWARRQPARVARLALVCTTPSFVARAGWPHAMNADTLMRFGDELRVAYRPTLLRFLSLQMHGAADAKSMLASLRRTLFARGDPSPTALAAALEVLANSDMRAEVPLIAQPALVIAGERDTLTPMPAAAWLATALPRGRLVSIAGAGHVPFLSHPAQFVDALAGFLAEHSTSGVAA